MTVLAVVEHDRGNITGASLGVLTMARNLAKQMNTKFEALTIGANADGLSQTVANFGATTIHQAHNEMLKDFGPEAWGESIAQVVKKSFSISRCRHGHRAWPRDNRPSSCEARFARGDELPRVRQRLQRSTAAKGRAHTLGWLAARRGPT